MEFHEPDNAPSTKVVGAGQKSVLIPSRRDKGGQDREIVG